MVRGKGFDADALPAGLEELALYEVRKADLPRLAGLARVPLKVLELRWVTAPDFTAIPLPEGLEELEIWHSPKLKSCDGIGQAPGLQRLKWWDTGALEDGSALAGLPELRVLEIEGGMNAKQKVASFDFLRGLRLERLAMNGIAPAGLDVAPVLEMKSLRKVEVHGSDLDIDSVAALAARFPGVHRQIVELEDYPASLGMRCKACGGVQKMLRLRRRKFLWCPACEAEALGRVLADFERRVEAARQGRGGGLSPGKPSKGASA